MVAVPAAIPVTTPEAFTVAIAVLLDVQAPPETVEVKVVVEPTQIPCVPESVPADGGGTKLNTILSVATDDPVTVIVNVTVPALRSAALGVYVAVLVVPLVNVPVPEVVHAIVPLEEVPAVV